MIGAPSSRTGAPPARAAVRAALTWALAAGGIIALAEFAVSQQGVSARWPGRVDWFARLIVHWVLAAVPFALVFAWIDRRANDRLPPWYEYAIVVGALAVLVIPVLAFLAPMILAPEIDQLLDGRPDYHVTLRFLGWQVVFWASLGAMLHRYDIAGRLAGERLRRAELIRTRREHELGRASIRATWARVVPAFLLDTLRRIDALYGRSPDAADRAITLLVAYLRLALAHHRRGVVPIASETALVEAYLRACGYEVCLAEGVGAPAERTVETGVVVPALHRERGAADAYVRADVAVDVAGGAATFRVHLAVAAANAGSDARAPSAAPRDIEGDAPRTSARRHPDGSLTLSVALPLAPPDADVAAAVRGARTSPFAEGAFDG